MREKQNKKNVELLCSTLIFTVLQTYLKAWKRDSYYFATEIVESVATLSRESTVTVSLSEAPAVFVVLLPQDINESAKAAHTIKINFFISLKFKLNFVLMLNASY